MTVLVWDQVGKRSYETGVERGVLYLPNGSGVPWSGLTTITERSGKTAEPIFFDGMKINHLLTSGEFEGVVRAVTYPDELVELEGLGEARAGVFFGEQPPQAFGLCYRTNIGTDLDPDLSHFKLHILYNVTALPNEKSWATMSDEPSLSEFEWTINAVPEEVPGFRPTAHIVIDSRKVDPYLLMDLQDVLYGSEGGNAELIPMSELVDLITTWFRFKVIDTDPEDDIFVVESARDEFVEFAFDGVPNGRVTFIGINALFLPDGMVQLSDTAGLEDVPSIEITDHGDGTWSATASNEAVISVDGENQFEIINANAVFMDEDTYQISDSTETG